MDNQAILYAIMATLIVAFIWEFRVYIAGAIVLIIFIPLAIVSITVLFVIAILSLFIVWLYEKAAGWRRGTNG